MRKFQYCALVLIISFAAGCDSNPPADRAPEVLPVGGEAGDSDWQLLWDARLAALEQLLGKSDDQILTATPPVYLGGGVDVLTFREHVDGVAYVTAGLVGDGGQVPVKMGEYELMMCFREPNDWAADLLSRLGPYTFEAALKPGETMDIAAGMPKDSTIAALLFVSYGQFTVNESKAGILLCLGITQSELAECQSDGPDSVLAKLKAGGVFPFTDPLRASETESSFPLP